MAKALAILILLLLIVLSAVSQSAKKTVAVEIPEGIVLATEAQRTFVSTLTNFSLGETKLDVERKLGKPKEAKADSLFYWLEEDSHHGGYYVTARLVFISNGLTSATLDFGHESKRRILPPSN